MNKTIASYSSLIPYLRRDANVRPFSRNVEFFHKQIFLPFGFRLGVMTQKNVVESDAQKFLRAEQRHSRLFGCAVAFALVAGNTSRHEILRNGFAALRSRQNMVERQILRVFVVAAVLTAIFVADINSRPLHRRFLTLAAHVNISSQTNHARNLDSLRRRAQNIRAVVFFDRHFAAKPQADRPRHANRAERFVRKI